MKDEIKANVIAVLFDLDGTLLDTDDQAVAKLAKRLRFIAGNHADHLARRTLMFAETPGNIFITLLDILGLDEPMMRFTDRLRRKRGVYPAHQFQWIPGTPEMLHALHGRYRIGIVTTRSRYHIDALLTQHPDIGKMVEVSCGLQDTIRLKPHPAPIQLAAKRLGIPVENCLMVGDTTVDVKSARRAGAWSVGVLCGFGQRKELEKAGAHLILNSTAELQGWL